MRRHTRTAVFFGGSLLALAGCDDADTIVDNDTDGLVTTAPAEPGNDKASLFRAPREARVHAGLVRGRAGVRILRVHARAAGVASRTELALFSNA